MKRWLLAVLAGLLLLPRGAAAATLRVVPGTLGRALAQAAAGDVIELADGVYAEPDETFPLTITRAVTLCAAEGAHPVVDAPAFKAALSVEAAGVTIRGLDIRLRRTGLYVVGDDFTAEDCAVTLADTAWRTSSCGAWLGGVRRCTLERCAFTGCSVAMAGPPLSESSRLVPCLTGLFEVGEDKTYFTTHSLVDCTVNGRPLFYAAGEDAVTAPAGAGQVIVADCGSVTVEHEQIAGASMGIILAYCGDATVRDCAVATCGVFGIYLPKNARGTIENCTVSGTNHAVDIRASSCVTVRACTAANCDQGIFLSHDARCVVRDCTVSGTGQGYFFAGGEKNLIDGCAVVACENGFNIQKEGAILMTRCRTKGNTICAMRLDGSPVTLTDSVLEGDWVGIMAYGGAPLDLTGNRITNAGACGLYLRDIAYSRICGNTISGSAQSGVQIVGSLDGTLLDANAFD